MGMTNYGLALAASALNSSATVATYVGCGTWTASESAAHPHLDTEITDSGLARVVGTVSTVTTTVAGDTYQ